MQGLMLDLPCRDRETINLTLYSDNHLDAKSCALDQLVRHMDRRKALPNSYFAPIGDVGNWIRSGKDKRYDPSVPRPDLAAAAAYINKAVDFHVNVLGDYQWLWCDIGIGDLACLQRGELPAHTFYRRAAGVEPDRHSDGPNMNDNVVKTEQQGRPEAAAVAFREAGRRQLPRPAQEQAKRARGGRRRFSVRGLPIRRELGEPASPGEEAAFEALLDRLKMRVLGLDGNPWAQAASTPDDAVPAPSRLRRAGSHSRSRRAPVALPDGAEPEWAAVRRDNE